MKRNVEKLYELFKGEHGNPFLPKEETYGNDGEYFVGGSGFAGQDKDDSIVDYNTPPGQLDFLTAIGDMTFPSGFGPFADRLKALAEGVSGELIRGRATKSPKPSKPLSEGDLPPLTSGL